MPSLPAPLMPGMIIRRQHFSEQRPPLFGEENSQDQKGLEASTTHHANQSWYEWGQPRRILPP